MCTKGVELFSVTDDDKLSVSDDFHSFVFRLYIFDALTRVNGCHRSFVSIGNGCDEAYLFAAKEEGECILRSGQFFDDTCRIGVVFEALYRIFTSNTVELFEGTKWGRDVRREKRCS